MKYNMTHAEQCPVCFAKGKVTSGNQEKVCHGCNGKGWVEVGAADYVPYIPSAPYPYPGTAPWPSYPWTITYLQQVQGETSTPQKYVF